MFAEYIISQVPFPLKQGLHKSFIKSVTELHSIIVYASSNYITRNELVIKHLALMNHKQSY